MIPSHILITVACAISLCAFVSIACCLLGRRCRAAAKRNIIMYDVHRGRVVYGLCWVSGLCFVRKDCGFEPGREHEMFLVASSCCELVHIGKAYWERSEPDSPLTEVRVSGNTREKSVATEGDVRTGRLQENEMQALLAWYISQHAFASRQHEEYVNSYDLCVRQSQTTQDPALRNKILLSMPYYEQAVRSSSANIESLQSSIDRMQMLVGNPHPVKLPENRNDLKKDDEPHPGVKDKAAPVPNAAHIPSQNQDNVNPETRPESSAATNVIIENDEECKKESENLNKTNAVHTNQKLADPPVTIEGTAVEGNQNKGEESFDVKDGRIVKEIERPSGKNSPSAAGTVKTQRNSSMQKTCFSSESVKNCDSLAVTSLASTFYKPDQEHLKLALQRIKSGSEPQLLSRHGLQNIPENTLPQTAAASLEANAAASKIMIASLGTMSTSSKTEVVSSEEKASCSDEEGTCLEEEASRSEEEASRSEEEASRSEEEASRSEEEASCSEEEASCSEEEASCSEEEASCSEEEASCLEEEASCSDEEGSCLEPNAAFLQSNTEFSRDITPTHFATGTSNLDATSYEVPNSGSRHSLSAIASWTPNEASISPSQDYNEPNLTTAHPAAQYLQSQMPPQLMNSTADTLTPEAVQQLIAIQAAMESMHSSSMNHFNMGPPGFFQ
ncbi:hypothetical protein FHG87_004039 [Trinorchestia longiramus]|nr:hypothetical protein FHG87_004039 [Trinorchestia longiramus]